ncbi:MAG: acetate kinase [Spirochaetota bacterium]|jgi:acetate kinase|nr:acetate kinase [Spirochaetota bacterium]
MYVLVLNSGSSSVKYQLVSIQDESLASKGLVEKIGTKEAFYSYAIGNGEKQKEIRPILNHEEALSIVFNTLTEKGVIRNLGEISAIGHRVVHGGAKFAETVLVTDEVMQDIRDCIELGPLHNPHNLKGIEVCARLIPGVPQLAVFDTAFHQTMPEYACLYALPYELYTRHRVRRYGFHGTSHRFIASRAAEMLGKSADTINIINCHLGNGASVCAIQNGKSVDTSMGFTPLEGLIMGTRSGDMDPAIIQYIMGKEKRSIQEVDSMLNKESGLLGISGTTNDVRELFECIRKGGAEAKRAELALAMMTYRLKKYVAAYMGVLNGKADAVVFTAGIGENNAHVRKHALAGLEFMGIEVDQSKNENAVPDADIAAESSRVRVLVIATNEEILIARDAAAYVRSIQK